MEAPPIIQSVSELKKKSKEEEKNAELEKKIDKFIVLYKETINKQLKIQSKYGSNISIINNKQHFIDELDTDNYYTYQENTVFTLKKTIKFIINLFQDNLDKFSMKTFEKMRDKINSEKHSKYFIKTILTEPFSLIDIQSSPINFNQAYEIHKKLNIPISDNELVIKWAIFALQDNNGSFYKIKSHPNSNNIYKTYSDRPFKQGWYFKLRKFCEDKNLLGKYNKYLNILNSLLIEHSSYKGLYGIKEFVELEKNIGETVMNMYYDNDNDIDEDKFTIFITSFENKKKYKLTNEQIQAIKFAIIGDLSIITGPPGTGKTTIVEAIIEWYQNENPYYNISLQAPTGKAIKGLLEKCENIKNKDICGTLHKCLLNTFPKIKQEINTGETQDKLPHTIHKIIVDEASMIDIFMFKKLLNFCDYFQCSLLLCGDINQLPPVGKGQPFASIINSDLFNTQLLTEIKRQDNGKLKDCIININNKTLSDKDFDGITTTFIEHDFKDREKSINLFKRIVHDNGKENIGIITPENGKEPGTFEMNKFLQNEVYNPNNSFYHGYFKEDDFIMRTENKYEEDVIRVNGDTGIINFVNKMIPDKNGKLKKRAVAQILYDTNEYNDDNFEYIDLGDIKDNFTLNYCNTVHKYQGSQKPVIVFICSPLHNSLSWGTNRLKLVYTAISRAQKKLIVIGDKNLFFDVQKCNEEPFITSFMQQFNTYEF
jgi:exodeoxyribonuclease V alpha subunit|uniref:UvrD-like helicase C-terminal domain-containing protein n=1 Tax=viral metagenome TaxID=1070528 RepID=A0A6C0CIR6_9ZZZZ